MLVTKDMLTAQETKDLLSFFPNGIIALDLETTGLSPISDRIIEVAAVSLNKDGEITVFHHYINPEIPIPERTIAIHQITDEMVADKPKFPEIAQELKDFLGEIPVIAHNAQFDVGFLMKEITRAQLHSLESNIFDSCLLARSVLKTKEKKPASFKLSSLAEFFSIPLNHHRALEDATACLRIFAQCIPLVENEDKHSFIKSRAFLFNLKSYKKQQMMKLDEKFQLLKEYIPTQKTIYIVYQGGTSGDKPRPVRPIGIIPLPKGLVLYAECLLSKTQKSFLLKKIKSVQEQAPT
ncbi:MAG: 3'-5' exonuclease [Bacteriovoracaceae bacterium]|nr:3'-5' exonuclease [Bacteriovoracaceae bacterium]